MEGYVFVYATNICKFLEVCVAFLVARNGEQFSAKLAHAFVLGNDDLRHLQQRNVNGDIGFITKGLKPSSTIRVCVNILLL